MRFVSQLEVVERLAARLGSGECGGLGAPTQFHCELEQIFKVPPEAPSPPPLHLLWATVHATPRTESPHPGRQPRSARKNIDASLLAKSKNSA